MNILQIILIIIIIAMLIFVEYNILINPYENIDKILDTLNLKFFIESDGTD